MTKVQTAKHSRLSVFLFLTFVFILYSFGIYSMIDIANKYQAEIDELLTELSEFVPLLTEGLPFILIVIVSFFFLTIIMSWIILQIMKHLATVIVLFMAYIMPLILIGLEIFFISTGVLFVLGLFLDGIGAILLIVAIFQGQRIRRSGKFIEFSTQLVLDEKALLIAPIIVAIFTMFTGVIMGFSFLEIWDTWGIVTEGAGSTELSDAGTIVALCCEYIYLIVYFGLYYIIAGFIVSYAFDWYRKEDPSLTTAWQDVKQVLSPIIMFGIIRATLEMLTRIIGRGTRRSMQTTGGRRGQEQMGAMIFFAIAAVVSSILIGIYRFFTYFTLPAIVIKKKGLKDSIKDSARMVWHSWLDVLIGETGFGLAMFFFNVLNFILWGSLGYFMGFVIFDSITGGIVIGIIMIIFSTIPLNIVTYPMGTAFKTFLYAYALDRQSGFQQPSRLPAELKGEFNSLVQDFESKDTKRKIPQSSF